jgi:hypothetical protein
VNTTPHTFHPKPHTQKPLTKPKNVFRRKNEHFIENSAIIKEIYCNIVNNRITILTIPHLLTYFIAFMTKSITQKTTTKQVQNLKNYYLSCATQIKYFTCLLILLFSSMGWGQTVTVGSGTNPGNKLPVVPYYGFSYSQQIVLKTDVNTSGLITKLRFYSTGTALTNSNNWTIYLGHTSKTTFSSNTDWIASSTMTQVFSGIVSTPSTTAGWYEIDINDIFVYNNIDNLVVAVDENATGDAGSSSANYFRIWTTPVSNRGIYYQSDTTNPDPTSISLSGTRTSYIAQMQLELAPAPTCYSPTSLSIASITNNSAQMSWTAPSSAPSSGYEVYFSTTNTAPTAGTPATATVPSGTSYSFSGLNASSTYYSWVRSNCGSGDLSAWVASSSFTTLCNPVSSLPWTEGFEGLSSVSTTTFPSCWLEGTGTNWNSLNASTSSYNDPRTGNYYIGCSYGGTNDRIWTPGFQLTAGVSYDFSTYFVGDGYSGWTGDIVYNTAASASGETVLGSSFITSSTTSTSIINYSQIRRTFVPSASGIYYFGIKITSSYSPYSYLAFDDFKLEVSPTCYEPTTLSSTNLTTTTATISWAAPINGTSPANYQYEVRTSGAAGSGATGLVSSGSVVANSVSANIISLTANTTYTFYVRSDCGAGDFSSWSIASTFTTLKTEPSNHITALAAGTITTTDIPLTWTAAIAGTQAPDGYLVKASSVDLNSITDPVDGTDPANVTAFTSNAANKKQTTGTASGTSTFTGTAPGTMYYYKVYSYTNSGTGIDFKTVNPSTLSHATKPNAVSSTLTNETIASNSIGFSWSSTAFSSVANEYIIFAKAGSAVTTGSPTLNPALYTANNAFGSGTAYEADSSAFCIYKGDATSVNLTGLSASTTYHFLIYAVVSNANSNGTYSFSTGTSLNRTTQCNVEIAPTIVQTFATFTGTAPSPACWSEATSSTVASPTTLTIANSEWLNSSGFANTGTNLGVKTNLYGTDSDDWLISQPIDLGNTPGVFRVKYDMAVTTYNATGSVSTLGSHIVRVIISTDGGSTWSLANAIKTYTGSGTYSNSSQTEYINLTGYSGVVKIAFVATTSSTSPDIDFHIDNFGIELIPNTWTGTTSNSWNTASNWSLSTVPTASDNIVISSNGSNPPVMDVDVTIPAGKSLTLTGGRLTIAPGKVLTIAGTANFGGRLVTFESNATGTAMLGTLTGTLTGATNVQVERFIPARRAYRFLSPSVSSSTTIRQNWQEDGGSAAGFGTHITGATGATAGFDPTETNNSSLLLFTNGAWVGATNTNVSLLTAGNAYCLMVRGDRTTDLTSNTPTASNTVLRAKGTLFTGNFSPVLSAAASGYSFIGNPYQAPLDIKTALQASTDVNKNVVYYWDPNINARGGYITRNLQTSLNNITSSVNDYVQPGQAFFVVNEPTLTSTPALTFTENHKSVANAAAGAFRNANTNEYGTLRVNLQANTNNQWQTIDGALAIFNANFTWNVTSEDATKMTNLDEEVSFVQNNTNLAIALQNNPSATSELPVKIDKMRHTNYQWKFELDNYDGATPYLFDTLNNSYTQINNGTVMPFTADANTTNRFKIVFQNVALSNATFQNTLAIYPNPAKAGASFYVDGITEATVTVSNLLGQNVPVETKTQGNTLQVTPNTSLSQGVYLVNITTQGSTQQVKWIVE